MLMRKFGAFMEETAMQLERKGRRGYSIYQEEKRKKKRVMDQHIG